jgi:hypothetical protein
MRATVFLICVGAALGGCDRTHMQASYGQTVRRALKAQVISPAAGERPAREQGLDPEEAAIVAKDYRESLSTRKEDTGRVPLVVLPTPQPGVPATPPQAR